MCDNLSDEFLMSIPADAPPHNEPSVSPNITPATTPGITGVIKCEFEEESELVKESKRDPGVFKPGTSCVMGIDEAGRGPVLGPMVYAGFVCPVAFESSLKKTGFADSKTLTREKRESLFMNAQKNPNMAWFTRTLWPEYLSRSMLRRSKVNLNVISHTSAASLVRKALDCGLTIEALYVDTVGTPAKYCDYLKRQFPVIPKIIVAPKADATYGPVSAASIVAKVTRDFDIEDWHFKEAGGTFTCSKDFGCGYPSDPLTKAWLRDNIDPIFGFPSIVRFSWKTCDPILEKGACPVDWGESDNDEEDGKHDKGQTKLFSPQPASSDRYSFFAENGMELVNDDDI